MSRKIENEKIIEWAELFGSASSEKKRKLFKRIAKFAAKPKRSRVSINLNRLDKYASASDNIIVPGKVLGLGNVTKSFNISALDYSSEAAKKLAESKCKMVSIKEMAGKPDIKLII
ncbi:50S ribosomal protein L18e [Candidatus Marsarchaeota archaeon]|nr:50S ribosomal protein L18e [Candidatus Marsarchaeota archaeon]